VPRPRLVPIVVAVGLAAVALAVVLVLSQSEPRAIAANGVRTSALELLPRTPACQRATVPAGTGGLRLSVTSLDGGPGPGVAATVRIGGRTATAGRAPAGWRGRTVTVPLDRRVERTTAGALVCVRATSPAPRAGLRVDRSGRFNVAFLEAEPRTWWSRARAVARHFGLGRPLGSPWMAVLAVAAMLGAAGLAVRTLLREVR